jgi:hypothetical protein
MENAIESRQLKTDNRQFICPEGTIEYMRQLKILKMIFVFVKIMLNKVI